MSEVYRVENLELQRIEALKILRATWMQDSAAIQRFRREARALDRLRHPNIVRFFDCGALDDGRFYLAMEFVEGQSLDRVLGACGALPISQVITVIDQLAD